MQRLCHLAFAGVLLVVFTGCGKSADQKPQPEAILIGCATQIDRLDQMKARWAQATGKGSNDVPTWEDLAPLTRDGAMPVCPGGGTYTLGPVGEPAQCSIPEHNAYFKEHSGPPPQQ